MNASETRIGAYQWWRWPLMPIAAVAASSIGVAALMFFGWLSLHVFGGFNVSGWLMRYFFPIVVGVFAGYFFAFSSCNVPPRGKVLSGIIMTTIYAMVKAAWVYSVWVSPESSMSRGVMESIIAVVGVMSAAAYVAIFHSERVQG